MASDTLRMMDISYSSCVDGIGFRDVVFTAFCPHHCEGCHNPQTWDYENGKDISCDEVFNLLTQSALTDVTFSGGEPFCQPEALTYLAERIKNETKKDIWVYSGYTFEEIIEDDKKRTLLEKCDVLVDGKFEINNRDLNMRFKGSHNQRIIDIKKSLAEGKVILLNL